MKRRRAAFFAILLLSFLLLPLRATAEPKIIEEFFPSGDITAPDTPVLRYSGASDDGDTLQLRYNVPKEILALSEAYNRWGDTNSGREGFFARFGVEEYQIYLQTDASIDDGEWQYSDAWDEADWPGLIEPHPLAFHCNEGLGNNPGKRYDDMEVSWLTYIEKGKAGFLAPIITPFTTNEGETNYHYDLANHTLTVRCRLVLEYGEDGSEQRIFSPWSKETSIGKNGTQEDRPEPEAIATPEPVTEPESVAAPDVISAPEPVATPVPSDSGFSASPWAQSELQEAAALGLIPVRLQDADLTEPITRAEFAAVSVKCYEALTETEAEPMDANPFTDTTDAEVLKAVRIGTTNGTGASSFSPDLPLSREQAATMLARLYKKIELDGWTLETDEEYKDEFRSRFDMPEAFADDENISGWAKDSVYFMKAKGIIGGIGNNRFAPRPLTSEEEESGFAQATREQAILIAKRMVQKLI